MILQTIERTLPADTPDEEFGVVEQQIRGELATQYPQAPRVTVTIYPPGFFDEADPDYLMRGRAYDDPA